MNVIRSCPWSFGSYVLGASTLYHTCSAETAARELDEVSEKMRDFFRRNPGPADIAGQDAQGPLDDAGREQVVT